jgi:hypothetical protein
MVFGEERPVDLLDVGTPVLHRLDGIGDVHQFAGGGFRIATGAGPNEFHW